MTDEIKNVEEMENVETVQEEKEIVTFLTSDNEKIQLEVVETLIVGDAKYKILAFLDNENDALVYRAEENADGVEELIAVDEDKELALVMEAYEKTFE